MKKLIALAILGLGLSGMSMAAVSKGLVTTKATVTQFPICDQTMAAGTLCRWVPLSELTVTLTQTNATGVPAKVNVSILIPPGMRSIDGLLHLETSGTEDPCSPTDSLHFEGQAGLTVDCYVPPTK